MRRRTHIGCGFRSPFVGWLWVTYALAIFICWSVIGLLWGNLLGLLGLLGYVPWLLIVAMHIWWEHVHSPARMYRTWWP